MIVLLVLAALLQDPDAQEKARKLSAEATGKMEAGDLDAALRLLDEAVRLAPSLSIAHALRGDCKSRKGLPEEAAKDLDRAFELGVDPRFEAYYRLARAWAKMAILKFEPAFEDAKKAIEAEPKSPYAFLTLGTLALRLGFDDEVVKAADRALALDPESNWAHGLRGQVHFRKGRLDDAVASFKEAQRLEPSDSIAPPCRAMVLVVQGKTDDALALFEKTLQDLPVGYSGLWLWKLRGERGDVDGAGQALRAMKKKPDANPVNAWHLKIAAHLEGSLSEAELLEEAKKATPLDAVERRTEALFFVGQALLRKGDRAAAADRFEQVRKGAVWAVEPLMADFELKRLRR